MIQRVQSFYLLLASIFYFVYWYFGLEWYTEGYSILVSIEFLTNLSKNVNSFLDIFLSITSTIPLIISTLCVVALFFFKNRTTQVKFSKVSFFLSIFMSLNTIIYLSFTLNGLIEIMPSKTLQVLLYAAILNPFICTYLIHSAKNSIKKDQDLVNSIDRIR